VSPEERKRPRTRDGTERRADQVRGHPRPVLFVQGGGAGTHEAWDARLVASLQRALGPAYTVRYPRMPDEASPDPSRWGEVLSRELSRPRDRLVLVGHSIGAAILLDHLAHGGAALGVAGIHLIAAPFIGEEGWPSEDLRPTREVARALRTLVPSTPLFLYQGTKDETVPVSHLALYSDAFPRAVLRRLEGRDHQLDDDLREVARDIRRLR
jgi:predicted alpha/beta hydrolase family esterase